MLFQKKITKNRASMLFKKTKKNRASMLLKKQKACCPEKKQKMKQKNRASMLLHVVQKKKSKK